MTIDIDAAFAVIQRALEEFNAEVGKARDGQAQSQETIASVEYEMEQLRKLIAENALDRVGKRPIPVAIAHLIPDDDLQSDALPAAQLKKRAS